MDHGFHVWFHIVIHALPKNFYLLLRALMGYIFDYFPPWMHARGKKQKKKKNGRIILAIEWPFGWQLFCVYVLELRFSFSFFLFLVQPLDFVNCKQCICTLFTVPQTTLFSNFFIINGYHSTIYTFKNYFATVFSVSVKISSIQTHPECGSCQIY